MLRVGLTGGIGSGKSSAAALFENLGVQVIDADIIVHELSQPGSEVLQEISQQLGAHFITPKGRLDRKKLASEIFEHEKKRATLEAILHPRVRQAMLEAIRETRGNPYLVLVIPLLLETDFTELCDRILVVDAPDALRIERVMARDSRSRDDIEAIMRQQVSRSTRLEKADDVLDNSGSLAELENAVQQLHAQYLQMDDTAP